MPILEHFSIFSQLSVVNELAEDEEDEDLILNSDRVNQQNVFGIDNSQEQERRLRELGLSLNVILKANPTRQNIASSIPPEDDVDEESEAQIVPSLRLQSKMIGSSRT